jgi:Flp pilus assembly protein TadB
MIGDILMAVLVAVVVVIAYFVLEWSVAYVKLRGTASYRRWKRRAKRLGTYERFERATARFLIVISVVTVIALIIWKVNV